MIGISDFSTIAAGALGIRCLQTQGCAAGLGLRGDWSIFDRMH